MQVDSPGGDGRRCERRPITSDELVEALEIIAEVFNWRLPHDRWTAINETIDAIKLALEANDADLLHSAIAALEIAGPIR